MAEIEGTTGIVKLLKDIAELQAVVSKTEGILAVEIDNLRKRKDIAVSVHMNRHNFSKFKRHCNLETEILRHGTAGVQEQVVLFGTVRVFSLLNETEYQVDIKIIPKEVAI
jgi:hypothetical protein